MSSISKGKKSKSKGKKAAANLAATASASKLFMKNVSSSSAQDQVNKSVTIQYDSSNPNMTIKTCDLNSNVCTTEEKPVPKGTFPNLLSLEDEFKLPLLSAPTLTVPQLSVTTSSLFDRLLNEIL